MKIALDTNILAYAEGINGSVRKAEALRLVERLSPSETFLPAQTLGELFQLLVRKANRTASQARAALLGWHDTFPLIETSGPVLLAAAELASRHRLSFWDGVVLASAATADCRLLLSEDLQDGFTWNAVTVTNPFGPAPHRLLTSLLS